MAKNSTSNATSASNTSSDSKSAATTVASSATTPTSQTAKVASPATITKTNSTAPTILNKGIKSTDGVSSQKVVIQQSTTNASGQGIVKLGANSQIRAVNTAGKGVQYVRVVPASGTGATTKVVVANGRQGPIIVQRKLVQSSQTLSGIQKTPTIVKSQFVTKKLEVTAVTSPTNTITARTIRKEAVTSTNSGNSGNSSAANVTNKPIVLNSGVASASTKDTKTYSTIKSEPTSPTSSIKSPHKVIYRSYKLGEDQKSTTLSNNNNQQQTTTLYSNLKLPSPEPAEGINSHPCVFCSIILKK